MKHAFVCLCFRLCLAITLAVMPFAMPPVLAAPRGVSIIVTTGLDDNGSTCDSNSCTLRGAINLSNGNSMTFNFIEFASTVHAVFVTNGPLPAITALGTVINGTYNSAFPTIYGASGGTFFINADYVVLAYLTIVNTSGGPDIEIDGGTNINIKNNYLGIGPSATDCTFYSSTQGTNGVRVAYNNAGTPADPVAYIYGNVISCHQNEGIFVGGATTVIGQDGVNVHANLIGLAPDGRHAAPNGYAGIAVEDWVYTAHDNLIKGNVISGNAHEGIYVLGTENTRIAANVIGLSSDLITQTIPIPNGYAGVALLGSYTTTMGTGIFDINVIAGNAREGIYVGNAVNPLIDSGNFVGGYLQRSGSRVTLACPSGWGNGLSGIVLDSTTSGAVVSPLAVGCNGGAGITTAASTPNLHNRIAPAYVAFNGGLPIDRGNDGVTPVNYPAISAVSLNGITPTISGTACANCQVYLYGAVGNPAASHGGGYGIGSTTANGAGVWSITASPSITNVVSSLTRAGFTANVIDTNGNTFELRPRPELFLPLIRR